MSKKTCTCTEVKAGPCRTREVRERKVVLSTELIKNCNSGEGADEAVRLAAHTWFSWAYPGHDDETCERFDSGAFIYQAFTGNWFMAVAEGEEGDELLWFGTDVLDEDDFLPVPGL